MSDPATSSEDWLVNLTSYLKTRKGLILAAEIIISFIIFICYAASWFGGYIAGSISEMIFALVIFVVFMMQWDKEFLAVNWLWTDFFRAFIGAWVYMITSLIVISRRHMDHAGVAGGVFGLIAGFLFAYDTYTICLQIKASRQKAAPPTVCSAGEKF